MTGVLTGTTSQGAQAAAGRLSRRKVASLREVSRLERVVLGSAGIVVLLVSWQVTADLKWVNPYLISSPTAVWRTGVHLLADGTLGTALASSGKLFGIAFAVSAISGVLIGAVMGWYRRINALVDPTVSVFYATPRIALIPLITAWFGLGLTARVVIVWLLAVFPIIVNVSSAVAAIDREQVQLARSFLATNKDVLVTIALPGAVPAIVAGIRQGMLMALIGVVVAEYFVGNSGVGGLIFNAGLTLDTAQVYVGAIVFALAALLMTALLRLIERRLDKWRA